MTHIRVTLIMLATLPALLGAQHAARREEAGRPAVALDSVPRSVADAERDASHYLRISPDNPRRDWDSSAHGTTERVCVDGDSTSIAQSGDFIVGPFGRYNDNWRNGYGLLTWQPAAVPRTEAPTLTVRAERLDARDGGRVFEGFRLTHSRIGPTQFYVTGVHLPTTGRWLLVATAGPNWGCFLFTVK